MNLFLFLMLIEKNKILLFLIPPSYMVVPNRELANKSLFNFPTHMIPSQNTNLPTVELFNNTGMDFFKE